MSHPERHHFRIEYPVEARPTFIYRQRPHAVVNLSERGALITVGADVSGIRIGGRVRGTIVFKDEEQIPVEGVILRAADGRVALALQEGVSFQRIMQEQRELLNQYGTLKQPDL